MGQNANQENIDKIYNSLPDNKKKEYLQRFNNNRKFTVGLLIAMPVAFVIMSIIMVIVYHADNFYSILAVAIFVCIITIIFIVAITFVIKQIKWTDEKKIKKQIEIMQIGLMTNTKNKDIKTNISYYPSNEENATILSLTNKFYLDFIDNSDLCNIVKKNIDAIGISIFDAELACCPFQKQIIEQITYTPMRFSSVLKNEEKQWKTIFCLPTVDNVQTTQYINFIKAWDEETVKEFYIGLTKIVEYKQNRTGVARGIYAQNNKYYDNFSKVEEIYSLLKRQQIIHNAVNTSTSPEIVDTAQYNAFLYIIRNYLLENLINAVNNILQALNIPISATQQEIITKLYDSPLLDKNNILTYYSLLEYSKNNNCVIPLTKVFHDNYSVVQKIIQDIQDKEKLNDLRSGEYQKKWQYTMLEIDNMSDNEFEAFIAKLFINLGYQAETTKKSGDQGVDVIAKKGGQIIAIQAKHYSQTVGNHAIMEVVGGAKFYNATLCYVVTNNYFTKSAKELAAANNVILWDRDKLIEKLSER